MRFVLRAVIVMLAAGAAALAGCKDVYETPQAFCSSFGTGVSPVWTCTGCTVANQPQVLDRDLDTASAVTPDSGTTGDSFSVRATAGTPFAGGATVGVWITVPAAASQTDYTLRTLKSGSEVETLTPQNSIIIDARGGTAASGFLGMRTTAEFDAVEFATANTWNAGQTPVYYLYELCADGGNA